MGTMMNDPQREQERIARLAYTTSTGDKPVTEPPKVEVDPADLVPPKPIQKKTVAKQPFSRLAPTQHPTFTGVADPRVLAAARAVIDGDVTALSKMGVTLSKDQRERIADSTYHQYTIAASDVVIVR